MEDEMKRLLGLVVAALLVVGIAQAPAKAATIHLDVNTTAPTNVDTDYAAGAHIFGFKVTFPPLHFGFDPNPFNDVVKVVITSTTGLVDLAITTVSKVNIANLSYKLYTSPTLNMASLVTPSTSNPSSPALSFAQLAAGTYYLKIKGSTWLGSYVTKLAATAVTPIPAALLMFMTALSGLGFAGYRRRKATA
jgi:hypothetical protein